MEISNYTFNPKKTIVILNLLVGAIFIIMSIVIAAGHFLNYHQLETNMVIFLSAFTFFLAIPFLVSNKGINSGASWGRILAVIMWFPLLFFPPAGTFLSLVVFYSAYRLKKGLQPTQKPLREL